MYAAPSGLQGLTHGPLTANRPAMASPFSSPSKGSPGATSGSSTHTVRHSRNRSTGGSCPVILEDLHGELQQPSWTEQARSCTSQPPAAAASSNSMTSARSSRGNNSFTRSVSAGPAYRGAAAPAGAVEDSPSGLRQGVTSVTGLAPPSAAELAEDPGSSSIARTLSNAIPQWMWPVGRSAVKDMTTEQIMRQIATGADVATLQSIARGLLVERNDWRREACAAQDRAAQLEQQAAQYKERCRVSVRTAWRRGAGVLRVCHAAHHGALFMEGHSHGMTLVGGWAVPAVTS